MGERISHSRSVTGQYTFVVEYVIADGANERLVIKIGASESKVRPETIRAVYQRISWLIQRNAADRRPLDILRAEILREFQDASLRIGNVQVHRPVPNVKSDDKIESVDLKIKRDRKKRADKLLSRIGNFVPRRHREALLGDLRQDVSERRDEKWTERKLCRFIWWQLMWIIVERAVKLVGLDTIIKFLAGR